MRFFSKSRVAMVVCGVTASLSVGVALAQQDPASKADPLVPRASTDQIAAFAVLGQSRTAGDAITIGPLVELAGQLETIANANVDLSRHIGSTASDTWLVPGDGQLCVVSQSDGRASFNCVPTAKAAAGEGLQTLSGGAIAEGSAIVSALVPDAARDLTLTSGSTSTRLAVHRNWAQTAATAPEALRFNLAGNDRIVAVGALPR